MYLTEISQNALYEHGGEVRGATRNPFRRQPAVDGVIRSRHGSFGPFPLRLSTSRRRSVNSLANGKPAFFANPAPTTKTTPASKSIAIPPAQRLADPRARRKDWRTNRRGGPGYGTQLGFRRTVFAGLPLKRPSRNWYRRIDGSLPGLVMLLSPPESRSDFGLVFANSSSPFTVAFAPPRRVRSALHLFRGGPPGQSLPLFELLSMKTQMAAGRFRSTRYKRQREYNSATS